MKNAVEADATGRKNLETMLDVIFEVMAEVEWSLFVAGSAGDDWSWLFDPSYAAKENTSKGLVATLASQ